jgi:hypothetical protein
MRRPEGSMRGRPPVAENRQPGRIRSILVGGLVTWASGLALAAAPDGLPALARTQGRTFSIPFRPPRAASADAEPRRVLLHVSRDLGLTWEDAGEAAPSAGSFSFRADVDGEYWFRLRTVDAEGRIRGGLGPDVRVLVNAAGPRVAGRVWRGENGEVVCRFAAVDDSIDVGRTVVEWRSTAEPQWQSVAASPVLSRESPAHLLGEEFWWAGDRTAGLVVRVSVFDASGNRSVKQFPLEQNDPGVDQGALAAEIGAPPLPSPPGPAGTTTASVMRPPAASTEDARPPAGDSGGVSPPGLDAWSAGGTGRRSADGSLYRAASARSVEGAPRPDSPPPWDIPADGSPTYRGRPLHLSRSRSFAWQYALPPDSTASRVELWGTLDGGVTWQRFAEDPDGESPIDVHLGEAALYGFRLEIGPADSAFGFGPRSGDSPDCWLGIDEEAPAVRLLRAAAERTDGGTSLRIDYESRDPLLLPTGTRLSYAPSAVGPWVTIAEGLEANGSFQWSPDRSVPAEVHLRVESRDAAGNVGLADSTGPVSLSVERTTGRLQGIVPVPSDLDR